MVISIFEELKQIVSQKTAKEINDNSNLRDLGIDSLDLLDLIIDVEEKFNIKITDDELLKIESLTDIINLIKNKL